MMYFRVLFCFVFMYGTVGIIRLGGAKRTPQVSRLDDGWLDGLTGRVDGEVAG